MIYLYVSLKNRNFCLFTAHCPPLTVNETQAQNLPVPGIFPAFEVVLSMEVVSRMRTNDRLGN